jgi:4-hydroxythreonine-4-phosphate dehydrogenase
MKSALSTYPRIVVTMGEASGIGPELLVKIAQKQFNAELIVLANSELLKNTAEALNLPLALSEIDWAATPQKHQKSTLKFEQVHLAVQPIAGKLEPKNSKANRSYFFRAHRVLCNTSRR